MFWFHQKSTPVVTPASPEKPDSTAFNDAVEIGTGLLLAALFEVVRCGGSVLCHRTVNTMLERAANDAGYLGVDARLRNSVMRQLMLRSPRRFRVNYGSGDLWLWA
jgi:hypothetical protein